MKPRYPLMQAFDELPARLPLYILENALLPGGELPLELSEPPDLALFLAALKTDQLIGMVQPRPAGPERGIYPVGCAGRIRQYRERKDGRLNIMLTGICRYRIDEEHRQPEGYRVARVDWRDYAIDYETEEIGAPAIKDFKATLRHYFDSHNMQVDWKVLDKLPIEQLVNNLVLVMNLDVASKQSLLESPTLSQRLVLFSSLLSAKDDPVLAPSPESRYVN